MGSTFPNKIKTHYIFFLGFYNDIYIYIYIYIDFTLTINYNEIKTSNRND